MFCLLLMNCSLPFYTLIMPGARHSQARSTRNQVEKMVMINGIILFYLGIPFQVCNIFDIMGNILSTLESVSLLWAIGRMLRMFTQLKRNKRFDNFIMLVWVQGSPYHIVTWSHPVQEV